MLPRFSVRNPLTGQVAAERRMPIPTLLACSMPCGITCSRRRAASRNACHLRSPWPEPPAPLTARSGRLVEAPSIISGSRLHTWHALVTISVTLAAEKGYEIQSLYDHGSSRLCQVAMCRRRHMTVCPRRVEVRWPKMCATRSSSLRHWAIGIRMRLISNDVEEIEGSVSSWDRRPFDY